MPMTAPKAGLAFSDHPMSSRPVLSVNVSKTKLPLWCVGADTRTTRMTAVILRTCHRKENLLKGLRMRMPNVLIIPTPRLVGAHGNRGQTLALYLGQKE